MWVGVVDGKAQEELIRGFGWLGSAREQRQCLACGRRTGRVVRRCGLRKIWRNSFREGNEGRKERQLVHSGKCLYIGNWALNRIRSDVVQVLVFVWELSVEG